ncbi:hypothetical protein ACFXJ8_15130 [Nonomuraea sp. NPDC059194]|uniref:hypothetical protein n=1 Tax=Nonomuraea sp. NPDC059194 TaxID=3346764 RepID=UPI0036742187
MGDDWLDWSGGRYEFSVQKEKPRSQTPVPDKLAGQWVAEPHDSPHADSGKLDSLDLGRSTLDTSDIVLRYRTPDGRKCEYKGEAFSVRGGILALAALEPSPPTPTPGCVKKRPTYIDRSDKRDDLSLRASSFAHSTGIELRRTPR